MNKLFSKSQLQSIIEGIGVRQDGINASIQTVLIHATMQGVQFSDVSAFKLLVDRVKGADRKAIMLWAHTHAPVKFNVDGSVSLNKGKQKQLIASGITLAELADEPSWTEYTPETKDIARSLDLLSRTEGLIKSAETADEKVAIKNGDFASFLKDAVAKFKAYQSDNMQTVVDVTSAELQLPAPV